MKYLLLVLLFFPFVSSAATLTPAQRASILAELQVLETELAALLSAQNTPTTVTEPQASSYTNPDIQNVTNDLSPLAGICNDALTSTQAATCETDGLNLQQAIRNELDGGVSSSTEQVQIDELQPIYDSLTKEAFLIPTGTVLNGNPSTQNSINSNLSQEEQFAQNEATIIQNAINLLS